MDRQTVFSILFNIIIKNGVVEFTEPSVLLLLTDLE